MIEITNRPDGSAIIEITPHNVWKPAIGQIFFTPNIVSRKKPVLDFDWSNNDNDKELLEEGLVFRTPEEAMEHRQFLRATSRLAMTFAS